MQDIGVETGCTSGARFDVIRDGLHGGPAEEGGADQRSLKEEESIPSSAQAIEAKLTDMQQRLDSLAQQELDARLALASERQVLFPLPSIC